MTEASTGRFIYYYTVTINMTFRQRIMVYGTAVVLGLGAVLGVNSLRPEPKQLPTFKEWRQQEIEKRERAIAVINYLITDTNLKGLERKLASVNTQIQILRTQQEVYDLQNYLKNLDITKVDYNRK